jgi:GNAT superfamily N-acetyltransferase
MADAVIERVGLDELPMIVGLFNQIFTPPRNIESFRRRYLGRYNVLQMIARIENEPVAFFLGFELKPSVFFSWFYGVLPKYRRQGIATQLMDAVHAWAVNTTTTRSGWSATTGTARCCTCRLPWATTSSASAGTPTEATTW